MDKKLKIRVQNNGEKLKEKDLTRNVNKMKRKQK